MRWIADDTTDWRGTRLERIASSTNKPYRLSDTKEWDRLAGDVITVVCGWISSTFPLPELLAVNATAELARSLRGQFMRGSPEWSLDAWTIARWLEDAGFVHVGSDTGITDHALLAVDNSPQ